MQIGKPATDSIQLNAWSCMPGLGFRQVMGESKV
jgi:hypothetical protein